MRRAKWDHDSPLGIGEHQLFSQRAYFHGSRRMARGVVVLCIRSIRCTDIYDRSARNCQIFFSLFSFFSPLSMWILSTTSFPRVKPILSFPTIENYFNDSRKDLVVRMLERLVIRITVISSHKFLFLYGKKIISSSSL